MDINGDLVLTLDKAISFITPKLEFLNSNVNEFFTGKLSDKFLPNELINEFLKECPSDLHCYFTDSLNQNNSLNQFIYPAHKIVDEYCQKYIIDVETFCKNFSSNKETLPSNASSHQGMTKISNESPKHKNTFMKEKKEHEVLVMSAIIERLFRFTNATHVIDIGNGKGYLSYELYKRGFKILGLEASPIVTAGAAKRIKKMQKQNSQGRSEDMKMIIEKKECKEIHFEKYKQVTTCVSLETNLLHFLKEKFQDEVHYKFGMVGLHTCGALANDSIKLFLHNIDHAMFLLNVGCCYNLLKEDDDRNKSFPMSDFLTRKEFKLGRGARMVACSNTHATQRKEIQKELPPTLMYRAVLEVFLTEKLEITDLENKKVGRMSTKDSKSMDFITYCKKSFGRLGLEFSVYKNDLIDLYNSYKHLQPLLHFYYCLKQSFQQIVELIILLDRVLFLQEKGLPNSFMVRMFDPQISPRNLAIVSYWKSERDES